MRSDGAVPVRGLRVVWGRKVGHVLLLLQSRGLGFDACVAQQQWPRGSGWRRAVQQRKT
jgi:hypothetical protein